MKIYLDLVFFINFMFDFLLLLTVKIILKRRVKWYRILLGATMGGLSIFFLFIKLNSITLFLLKGIISILMILISMGRKNFIKNMLYLYFVSILLGGFLYYLNLEFSYDNIGLVFFHNGFSINFILLLILSPIILYLYIKQNKELKMIQNYHYQVDVYYGNQVFHYQAYLDTGNKLYDPYFKRPIILLYDTSFPEVEHPIYVPYQTLEHTGLLPCFKVEKIILDQTKVIPKPWIALSKEPFQMKDIDMILHKDYLE